MLWPARLLCPWNFSRQEYWSELPFPSPGDLRGPGIEPESLASPASAGGFFTTMPPGKLNICTPAVIKKKFGRDSLIVK